MKVRIVFLFLAATIVLTGAAQAAVLFNADFDGLTKDYQCCVLTGSGDCGPSAPPGFSGFHQNNLCGNYGNCNTQILGSADRKGGSGNRGFRINLEQRCFPTGENSLTFQVNNLNRFYIRWYQRMSLNSYDNFVKLFRMYSSSSGQILIPEFHNDGRATRMNLAASPFSSNNFNTSYSLNSEYTPGTWVCYEIFIDIPNQQWTFWVNGDNKGTVYNSSINRSWTVRTIDIGGNQYGNYQTVAPREDYIDYDDVVVSDSYIGPGEPIDQGPVPPTGLRVVQ